MVFYWIGFAVYCLVHLTLCFLEREEARKITKVLIIPFLSLSLVFTQTNHFLVILGLFFGWLGDVFLIFTGRKRYFIIGAGFFALGHFAYIAATLGLFFAQNTLGSVPVVFWCLLVLVTLVLFALAKRKVSKHLGVLAYVGAAYFSILFGAFLVSILLGNPILVAAFGIFVISDIILSICRFAKKVKRSHFYVMSTYILAQTLICISFICG